MLKVKQIFLENKYIAILSVFLLFGMYVLNHYFPITLDDWGYALNVKGGHINNLWEIIEREYVQYFDWGGRSVVHTIAQIMLALGVFWGDVINSIGYIILILVIYYIANKGNKENIPLFIGLNFLIWFLSPSLIENVFWITGSANYMWGTMLILALMSFYCSAYLTNRTKDSRVKRVSLFLFGIIAGWTNENTSVAMILFIVALLLLMKRERQALPGWMIFGLAGAVIGCAFMLAAPGNYVRNANEMSMLNPGGAEPMYMFYFYRFTNILKLSARYALVPAVIYVASLLMYIKFKKERDDNRILVLSLLFAITAAVATLAMVAAPSFANRVWFAILILLFIGTGLLYANCDFSKSHLSIFSNMTALAAAMLFVYSYWVSLNDFVRIHDIWAERDRIVLAEKERGVKDVVLYGRFRASDSWFVRPKTGDIPLDTISWMQQAYGHYMGVESVKIFDSKNKKEQ